MKVPNKNHLVDKRGQPFSDRIQKTLVGLLPRFRRLFPTIRDQAVVAGILEETGQRIVEREEAGNVERLHAFAWTTLRNLTVSMLRQSDSRVEHRSIGSTEGEMLLSRLPTDQNGPEVIEQRVLLQQAMRDLTPRERKVALLKQAKFSSEEIGEYLQMSPGAVDQMYFRARHKLRKILKVDPEAK